jgi:2-polyprenyl-3-methyl-5-hydroxy-6-metoxy-1,4-benzoquinol methylase
MSFFEQYPEFVDQDTRKDRGWCPTTAETLDRRHSVLLPKWLVENNSILDLGSCLGATGHWVMSHGARDYTGVEVQESMASKSKEILSKHWSDNHCQIINKDIREFIKQEIKSEHKYDVVLVMGIIYAFLDTHNLLEELTKICKYCIVVDSLYPRYMISPDAPIIDIFRSQAINSSHNKLAFSGAGARPSPNALKTIMASFGFEDKEGIILPVVLEDKTLHDAYLMPVENPGTRSCLIPSRFMMRFYNTENYTIKSVGSTVTNNETEMLQPMTERPVDTFKWEFDSNVAETFYREAEVHIPDYHRVIDLCGVVTEQIYGKNKEIKIIDVGSAIGSTVEHMIERGYNNTYGVECSESMITKSVYQENIIHSKTFPEGSWDVVFANWTLHFIHERKEYLQSIYNNMNENGVLIVSDKMNHTIELENMYHKMKLDNGATPAEIQRKKESLVGVLTTKPLEWYLDTLKKIGFSNIQIINSKFMFNTIYARKI